MTHRILFVDDEENILKALGRLMRKSGYESTFVQSGKEALELIKRERFSVVVTDMRMPEMSGLDLVKAANEVDRLSVKIILSGYSEIDDIMSAVNGGHIHSYITKPWQETGLMITLMNACDMFERRMKEQELLQELKEKNEQLRELNENLESLVAAKTREIQAGNRLLSTILKGGSEEQVLRLGSRGFSDLMDGKPVWTISFISGNGYCSDPAEEQYKEPPEQIKQRLGETGKALLSGSTLYLPLRKRETLLGVLVMENAGSEVKNRISRGVNLVAGLTLFLTQQQALGKTSEMISSIDMLLEETDAES